MKNVLIATRKKSEGIILKQVLERDHKVTVIDSPQSGEKYIKNADIMLLDENFTDLAGIDFLMEMLKISYVPVLMLSSENDPQAALEAMRSGATNYVVKTGDYFKLLNLAINDAIGKFNERESMKQTILELKEKVADLEHQLDKLKPKETKPAPKPAQKMSLMDELISRFKSGEVNLPPVSRISLKFRKMVERGADMQEISSLLKQDPAISSKLINIANSAFYRGLTKYKTLDDAVTRLGLSTTRQYVEVIANRSLYTAKDKTYAKIIDRMWEHSLAVAYAADTTTQTLGLKLPHDPFTLGLLHDIGKLVLIQVIGEIKLKDGGIQTISMEEIFKTLELFHGRFGAVLLKRWEFPEIFIEVAQGHNNVKKLKNPSQEMLIVDFANQLAHSMGLSLIREHPVDLTSSESGDKLRLRENEIAAIRDKTKELLQNIKQAV